MDRTDLVFEQWNRILLHQSRLMLNQYQLTNQPEVYDCNLSEHGATVPKERGQLVIRIERSMEL